MGIKNFKSYAKIFFGRRCFKEFDIGRVYHTVKDFSYHELCLRAAAAAADAPAAAADALNTSALADRTERKEETRCGLYIDLSSLQYGCLLRSLEENIVGDRRRRRDRILFTTDTSDIDDATDEGETGKTVVCQLKSGAIAKIASDCAEKLIDTLRPLLTKAYRVYLAFDSRSPKAKRYEQASRKTRAKNFSLSYDTRVECYKRIVADVRAAVFRAHRENLESHLKAMGRRVEPEVCSRAVEAAIARQFASDTVPFGEGEWKCFYRMYDDTDQDLVDTCYVFGRDWDIGFAMTMYQHPRTPDGFKYVYGPNDMLEHVKRFDAKERALHFACFNLIGNDYVCRLVNPSEENLHLLKSEFDKMYEGGGGGGSITARQVDYLSKTLFFVRSGNRDESNYNNNNTDDDSAEMTRMKISVAFATVFARLLSAIYTLKPEEIENALARQDTTATAQILQLRQQLKSERAAEAAITMKPTTTTTAAAAAVDGHNAKILVCKDARGRRTPRTFQQCLDSFAMSVLWYLSYTRFYFCSSGRQTFTNMALKKQQSCEEVLRMPVGLHMDQENVFLYNDSRLSPCRRFDIQRLLDVKKVIRGIEPLTLFWILQNAFENALESRLIV